MVLTRTNWIPAKQENKESTERTSGMAAKNPLMVKLVAEKSPKTQGYQS